VHRTIEITVPASYTDALIQELERLEQVINLSVVRGASVKPEGDVLTVHALNNGADEVLRLADAGREQGHVSVTTAELTSLIDPEHERRVANDIDEAL
jgi:FAD/FMN-containing dehydrogenase